MKQHKIFLLIVLFCSFCFADVRLVCYFNSVTAYNRSGNGHFTVDNINPHLCTHLIYNDVLLDVDTNSLKIKSQNVDIIGEGFKKFVALKKYNPKLTVLIQLYVDKKLRDKFLALVNNNKSIDTLVASVLKFFNEFGFDGLHLSYLPWLKKETAGYMNLLKALSQAFQPGGYLLGGSGSRNKWETDLLDNDIPHLSSYLDYLFVETSGFYNPYLQPEIADHHTALYPQPWQNKEKCADFVITYWISKGFPANKIILRIALYGRSWTIKSNTTNPPVNANGPGTAGKITNESGVLAYYEICHAVKFDGWQVFDDPLQKMGPYAVSPVGDNRTWVGYDDPSMAIVKAKYVLSNKLGGIAIWDMTLDDFGNVCGEGNYPVTSAVWHTLFSSKIIKQLHLKWMILKKIDNFILKLTGLPSI